MSEYVWKHLPYAIYLDTNALRTAGPNLDAAWINELLSITNEYGISICISELVLAEWCEHIIGVLEGNRQKLLSSLALLKRYGVSVLEIVVEEINLPARTRLLETVSGMMQATGFTIVPNWNPPLPQLLSEAVAKRPPFDQGGKGLCDAVIMESYAEHAKAEYSNGRVLVISNDSAVKRSEARFKDRGIGVDFVGESEIVSRIKSLLDSEAAAYLDEKKSRLRQYVMSYEPIILDFVKSTPLEITDWMLNPPFAEPQDRLFGTIESIISVTPLHVVDIIGGSPTYGQHTAEDRYPVRISVEIELNVIVSEYGMCLGLFGQTRAVIQPDALDQKSPVILERTFDLKPREFNKTIKRKLSVLATLDAEKEKSGALEDFRIEKIL